MTYVDTVGYEDKEKLKGLYEAHWEYKSSLYEEHEMLRAFIAYKFVSKDTPTKISSDRDISTVDIEKTHLRINDSIPTNCDFKSWGE